MSLLSPLQVAQATAARQRGLSYRKIAGLTGAKINRIERLFKPEETSKSYHRRKAADPKAFTAKNKEYVERAKERGTFRGTVVRCRGCGLTFYYNHGTPKRGRFLRHGIFICHECSQGLEGDQ